MSVESNVTCYDVIGDLDSAMRGVLAPGQKYFVLGGIASGAIMHEKTEIDHGGRSLVPTRDSGQSIFREAGSRRDVDILVDDVLDDERAARIKGVVQDAIDGQLIVSVFGFEHRKEAGSKLARAAGEWLSSRTIDDNGVIRYELFPLVQEVDASTFEEWKLELPQGNHVSVLNPAGHTLAYGMRSISGVRHKDTKGNKYGKMVDRVFDDPVFCNDIQHGRYRPWLDFACAIYDLRDGRLPRESPLISPTATRADIEIFRAKSKSLHFAEGLDKIVDFAQQDRIQEILNIFIRAK